MKVVINQAKLRIKLKARDSESWAPEFTIDVKNVVIQTTNDQYKVCINILIIITEGPPIHYPLPIFIIT